MEDQSAPGREESLRLASASLKTTKELLERFRYRVAGSPECRGAARAIAELFRASCDGSRVEPFTLHPKALWCVGRALAAIYLLASASIALGGAFAYAGCGLCLMGFAYGFSQYVLYGRLFDPLFKSAEGCNVVGTLEPTAAVERQVVLVGHHDSPYIFSFLERFQAIAFVRFLLGIASFLWLCVYATLLAIRQLISGERLSARGAALWITAAGLIFAAQLFFMMSRRPSPGAGDDLNATSMNAEVAGYFRDARNGGSPLRRTRLILLSTDGEEIGQRGAMEYARRHAAELHATRTYVVNVDSVYYSKDLAVVTRDRNCTRALSRTMAAEVRRIAAENGVRVKTMPIPFGGGGTDAAAFAAAGIEATTLIAQPAGLFCSDHRYHTSKDVVEGIEPEAVGAIVELVIGFVRKLDRSA